jgi:hypothetical protein
MDTPQSSDNAVKADAAEPSAASPVETSKSDAVAWKISIFASVKRACMSAGASVWNTLAARPRLSRASVLAASIAVSAALGSMVGAWAAVVFVKPPADPVATVIASTEKDAIAKLSADIAALKASVDSMAKNSAAQYARISERVEKSEKAQGEPAAKIARLADAVEKLERKTSTASAAPAAAAPEITGSIVPKQQDKPPVVSGWVLREVFDGAAMVESRHGLYEVVPGANLPGLGRVQTIRRQDGRWVVVTPKGLIVSSR